MRTRMAIFAAAILVIAALGGYLVVRAMSGTVAPNVVDGVSVECSGWTGVADRCAAWGADVLGQGSPSTTFEIDDVVRLRFDRPAFGFAPGCVAEYFLSRYPDEVVWTAEVRCPTG